MTTTIDRKIKLQQRLDIHREHLRYWHDRAARMAEEATASFEKIQAVKREAYALGIEVK